MTTTFPVQRIRFVPQKGWARLSFNKLENPTRGGGTRAECRKGNAPLRRSCFLTLANHARPYVTTTVYTHTRPCSVRCGGRGTRPLNHTRGILKGVRFPHPHIFRSRKPIRGNPPPTRAPAEGWGADGPIDGRAPRGRHTVIDLGPPFAGRPPAHPAAPPRRVLPPPPPPPIRNVFIGTPQIDRWPTRTLARARAQQPTERRGGARPMCVCRSPRRYCRAGEPSRLAYEKIRFS